MSKSEAWSLLPAGLEIRANLPFEQWEQLGHYLGTMLRCAPWAIGDWLIYGATRSEWGEMYSQGMEATGLEYATLANYKWIASSIPQEERHPNLTFSHHAQVARLASEKRKFWLDLAEKHNWTVLQLRREVTVWSQKEQGTQTEAQAQGQKSDPGEDGESLPGPLEYVQQSYLRLSEDLKEEFRRWLEMIHAAQPA